MTQAAPGPVREVRRLVLDPLTKTQSPSPVISLGSVISIRAVSTNRSAHLLAGELLFSYCDLIAGHCLAK